MDALGHAGEEGRRRPRKCPGSCQAGVDPDESEWGNPQGGDFLNCMPSEVGM